MLQLQKSDPAQTQLAILLLKTNYSIEARNAAVMLTLPFVRDIVIERCFDKGKLADVEAEAYSIVVTTIDGIARGELCTEHTNYVSYIRECIYFKIKRFIVEDKIVSIPECMTNEPGVHVLLSNTKIEQQYVKHHFDFMYDDLLKAARLSDEELAVFDCKARGMTDVEGSAYLGISRQTFQTRKNSVQVKIRKVICD